MIGLRDRFEAVKNFNSANHNEDHSVTALQCGAKQLVRQPDSLGSGSVMSSITTSPTNGHMLLCSAKRWNLPTFQFGRQRLTDLSECREIVEKESLNSSVETDY